MKKSAFSFFVFLYVLLYFVIPPVVVQFFSERQEVLLARYPFPVFFNGIIAFFIYIFSIKGRIFDKPILFGKQPFFVYSSSALICFGILCLSSVLFEGLAHFFTIDGGIQKILFPSSFFGWTNFFFGVIFAAFFEEVIYRFYLPRAFREIFGKLRIFGNQKSVKKDEIVTDSGIAYVGDAGNNLRLSVLCEGLALLLFGLGHLYLGLLGFLNALLCGSALRFCMIKTKSLWISFGIHVVYNFLSFLMAFLLF